jgi:hypothetical protein
MDPGQVNPLERYNAPSMLKIKASEESELRNNTLSPVSSLHPELFAAIFSFLCLPGASSLDGEPDHHLERLRVSHVCHQWRQIALNLPLLWSHVDFNTLSLAGAAEILFRAKSVPLYLDASIFGRRWDNIRFRTFQRELQAHVPCIYRLRTSAEPAQLRSTLEGLVSPAPTLEYLSLSSHSTRDDDRRYVERVSIPDTLFDGSTPRLSWLDLRNCGINWNSPLLKGLKYLEIFKPSPCARPKLTVWLDALGEMPQLKALTLHEAAPIPPPFPADVERTVSIPSLTHLDILGSPRGCTLALAHLDLPALTCLCLAALSCDLSSGGVQSLLPYITRHSMDPRTPNLFRVCLSALESATETSLHGLYPISTLRYTTRPPCSLRSILHARHSPSGAMPGLFSMNVWRSSTWRWRAFPWTVR